MFPILFGRASPLRPRTLVLALTGLLPRSLLARGFGRAVVLLDLLTEALLQPHLTRGNSLRIGMKGMS